MEARANGFPPGSVVLRAEGELDEIPFVSQRANDHPVWVDAADGLVSFDGTNGFVIDFSVPCNGEIADVKVWWSVYDSTQLEGPPALGIEHLPEAIECPDTLALSLAWASDPDEDYATLQWFVDGVLLDETWPTIPFTESHEITAMLRDARGATATATRTITCE